MDEKFFKMNFNDMGFVAIKLYYLIDDFTVQFYSMYRYLNIYYGI